MAYNSSDSFKCDKNVSINYDTRYDTKYDTKCETKCGSFEQTLVYHTAPSLAGIKCANLVSFDKKTKDLDVELQKLEKRTINTNIKVKILCECKGRMLLLLYNQRLLDKNLRCPCIQSFLVNCGYSPLYDLEEYLCMLSSRIKTCDSFPHEIGLFLDYPIEDVIGFIDNKGRNFKCCGFWKVYGDEKKARQTFKDYNKCREFLCNKVQQGFDIYSTLETI